SLTCPLSSPVLTCALSSLASPVLTFTLSSPGSGLADLTHLRLAGGAHRCAGRVQVLHEGRWGGVCALTWATPAADVTCRSLGCGPALRAAQVSCGAPPTARTPPSPAPCQVSRRTWAGEPGEAPLRPIPSGGAPGQGWGRDLRTWGHTWDSWGHLGTAQEGQVRLAGGPHRCAGRVEVFHAGRWGTVCDDSWELRDAQVTCRQVRCGHALWAPGAAQFGEGAGPIWLDGLRCVGTETHLARCPARPWGEHTCNHVEDASAICSGEAGQVRLSGAPDRCAGRVEVRHQHLWGTVCDDTWGLREAQVLCAHLGCGPALEAPGAARYGRGSGPIWLDDVTCTGEEPDLFRCAHRTWGQHNCHHGEDAGVVCAGERGQVNVPRCVWTGVRWEPFTTGAQISPVRVPQVTQAQVRCGWRPGLTCAQVGWRCCTMGPGGRSVSTAGTSATHR
uniref:Soluble scavenger receptor cysteine-rich domain-containing protein SSC5D n=1 Tax=Cyanoderma ruficeps TaxID=181631 RepID=A0A8C3P1N1_9PASS